MGSSRPFRFHGEARRRKAGRELLRDAKSGIQRAAHHEKWDLAGRGMGGCTRHGSRAAVEEIVKPLYDQRFVLRIGEEDFGIPHGAMGFNEEPAVRRRPGSRGEGRAGLNPVRVGQGEAVGKLSPHGVTVQQHLGDGA